MRRKRRLSGFFGLTAACMAASTRPYRPLASFSSRAVRCTSSLSWLRTAARSNSRDRTSAVFLRVFFVFAGVCAFSCLFIGGPPPFFGVLLERRWALDLQALWVEWRAEARG